MADSGFDLVPDFVVDGDTAIVEATPVLGGGTARWGRFRRNRFALAGAVILVVLILLALIGPFAWHYSYSALTPALSQPPSLTHPMGTDDVGHDLLAQCIHGLGKSLTIGVVVAFVSTAIGTLIGAVAGYFGGRVDAGLMRFTDLVLTIPLIAILVVLAKGVSGSGNTYVLGLVIASVTWTSIARIVRATFLGLREEEFVLAAISMGASHRRVIFRHLLPNAIAPIIVHATLTVAIAILLESTLSFLGLGIQPPDTSLGLLVAAGQDAAVTRPWLLYFPLGLIVLLVLSVNFVGDGLREVFDPRSGGTDG